MSRESDFASRMTGDATLMAMLTGGVFQSGLIGREGISRDTTPGAFSGGYLQPVALVRERSEVPDGDILDPIDQDTSVRQTVEIWLYDDSQAGFSAIDTAINRLFTLFQGYQFSNSAEVFLINVINRQRDQGALMGSPLARTDWLVPSVRG